MKTNNDPVKGYRYLAFTIIMFLTLSGCTIYQSMGVDWQKIAEQEAQRQEANPIIPPAEPAEEETPTPDEETKDAEET